MAAGIVYHNITTAAGVTFALACWVPDTAAPDVGAIPVSLPINSAGDVADPAKVKITNDAGTVIDPIAQVAHDAADSGAPIKTGAKAVAGLAGATLVTAADRINNVGGLDGALYVRTVPLEDIVQGKASNTDGTVTSVIGTAGAGIKQYLTKAILVNMHPSTVAYVELISGSTSMAYIPCPPGGCVVSFDPPLKPNAADEAWSFDPSAAVTTLYCSLIGFKSKV